MHKMSRFLSWFSLLFIAVCRYLYSVARFSPQTVSSECHTLYYSLSHTCIKHVRQTILALLTWCALFQTAARVKEREIPERRNRGYTRCSALSWWLILSTFIHFLNIFFSLHFSVLDILSKFINNRNKYFNLIITASNWDAIKLHLLASLRQYFFLSYGMIIKRRNIVRDMKGNCNILKWYYILPIMNLSRITRTHVRVRWISHKLSLTEHRVMVHQSWIHRENTGSSSDKRVEVISFSRFVLWFCILCLWHFSTDAIKLWHALCWLYENPVCTFQNPDLIATTSDLQ